MGVVDAGGVAHTASVGNNVYAMSDVPAQAVRSIVAYAASGEQVVSAPLPGA